VNSDHYIVDEYYSLTKFFYQIDEAVGDLFCDLKSVILKCAILKRDFQKLN
jgi:hypothetical protein